MTQRDTYPIVEIFHSWQGEGVLQGRQASFIRLFGCPVHCSWCDSKYTWNLRDVKQLPEKLNPTQIIDRLNGDVDLVVITGGEPLLYDLDPLLLALHQEEYFTQIETSGALDFSGAARPNFLTWSPKPARKFEGMPTVKDFADEVKWVVDDHLTVEHVRDLWEYYRCRPALMMPEFVFMPEGCPPTRAAFERAVKILNEQPIDEFGTPRWRICDRLQYRLEVK